jgi:protein CLEC16A
MTKKCKKLKRKLNFLDYILSHPFLNKLITFQYNYYDEELVDIYIAFLKSLAL